MAGNDYWERRNLKDKARAVNRAEDYIAGEQKKYYEKASEEIRKEIEKLYQGFADKEKISLAQAKAKIRNADFAEINWEGMISQSQEFLNRLKEDLPEEMRGVLLKQHEKLDKKMRAYAKRGSISYLELKDLEIRRILADMYDKQQLSIYDFLKSEWEDGYYRSIYNIQQHIGFGYDFIRPSEKAVKQALMQGYDKRNFSRTLYQHCGNFSEDLKENLVAGLIRGEPLEKTARRISRRMEVAYSRARTLVRTETANIYEQAAKKGYEEAGVEWYEYLASLDNRTSEVCRELDGKHFRLADAIAGKNYPPMHPNCRSTTVCWFPDEEKKKAATTRIAKSDRGKYYEVPADMTYKEWRKEHVKGKPFMMGNESAAVVLSDVNFADSHKELEQYLRNKYRIAYDSGMENLNLDKVKRAVKGMERVFDKFSGTADLVQICTPEDMDTGVMACGVSRIKFNPAFFNEEKRYKLNLEKAGCHEAAHLLEWQLLDTMGYKEAEKEEAWNEGIAAERIVAEALAEVKRKYPGKTEMVLRQEISTNATDNDFECLADAVTVYLFQGKNASALSKEIYRKVRKKLNGTERGKMG